MPNLINFLYHHFQETAPNLPFQITDQGDLSLPKKEEQGFNILVQEGKREHALHFDAWHLHFAIGEEGQKELLAYLKLGLSSASRLEVFSRNKKPYKWTFERYEAADDYWQPLNTMGLLNFKIWQRTSVAYYQNGWIPAPQNPI